MIYDAVGNLISHTDFNGDTTTHQYDVNDRLVQSDYSDGSQETYAYDAEGNRTQATIIDTIGTRTWTYNYDARNRLLSETQPNGTTLCYAYDNAGNKTALTLTQGPLTQVTRYAYDALNRLSRVTDPDGNITTYGYDAVGNRTQLSYDNGNRTAYTFDERNRLTDLTTSNSANAVLQQFSYTLHPTGRRTQIDEADGRRTNYSYDTLYRLAQESIADADNGDYSASYSYDATGNRIESIIDGVTTQYTYDENDRLTQQGGYIYSYDEQGNTLTETLDGNTTTYAYNSQQELISTTHATGTTTYTYNPDGIRTEKEESGQITTFTVDSHRDYAQVIRESNGTETKAYVYGDDLISQATGAATQCYHYDGLGSTRSLSDSAGSITDSYHYEAFGQILNQTGTTENSYLYTGEQFDQSLNQYYLRARYYNQRVARFTQMDTWMGRNHDPITLHKYLYANADPGNMIDPTGNFSIGSVMSAIGNFARLTTTATINVGRAVAGRVNGSSIRGVASFRARLWLTRNVGKVQSRLPKNLGSGKLNKKGTGWRWNDGKGNGVRVDRGNPKSSSPSQRPDHVVINSGGKIIGKNGKPINGSIKNNPVDAHSPLKDWLTWPIME